MPEALHCGHCGRRLPADAPAGVCPGCVLTGALLLGGSSDADPSDATAPSARGARLRYVGDYELLERIGSGGMGEVWKARQCSLNRVVAVKMILGGELAGDEAVRRFQREAELVAQLRHPHIVTIHETGQHEGRHYFSMDFVEGSHLARRMRGNPLPAAPAVEYVRKVAEAVHFAHQRGIVHRDLKPQNILIDPEDQPRVTDFGLAKHLTESPELTGTGQALGTPSYMAPEQADRGRGEVGPTSDVFALGGVLYFLATARPAFLGATREETLRLLLTAEPVPPRALNPNVPRDLETICLKCLEKESARRYASAQALAEDLGRFLRHEPIRARPVSRAERLWRWCRRHPAIALPSALAAMLLFAVALVSTVSAIHVTRARNHAQAQQKLSERREAESRQRLAQLKVREGWQRAEGGDLLGALAPFAGALLLETNDPARVETHRYRISAVCPDVPRITRMWFPGGPIQHIERSPDGRRLLTATASWNGATNAAAQVWDAQTGQPVSAPMLHAARVNHAAFSPDGRLIVTASDDHTARVWDAATGQPITKGLPHHARVVHAAFSPDSQRIVTGVPNWSETNGAFVVWDALRGAILSSQRIRGMDVQQVTFTPEGKRVLVGCRTYLCNVFDAQTSKRTASVSSWDTRQLRYSPDRRQLAVAGSFGDQRRVGVRIFDAATLDPIGPLLVHENSPAAAAAFSPDGSRLATGGTDQRVHFWEISTGRRLSGDLRHSGPVVSVEFSPDGRLLVTASSDYTARVWDGIALEPAAPPLRHAGAVCGAFFLPDGQEIVTGSKDGAVRVWRVRPESPVCRAARLGSDIKLARHSPGGQVIATGERDGHVRFWNAREGRPDKRVLEHPAAIQQVDFASDGQRILTCSSTIDLGSLHNPGAIRVWSLLQSGPLPPQADKAMEVARFSPDARYIAAARRDSPSALLDSVTRRPIAGDLHTWLSSTRDEGVSEIRFSPDGRRLVTAQQTGWAVVWELASQRRVSEPMPHTAALHDACFSRDGQWIATGCQDGTARVWPVAGGTPASPPLRHIAPVRRVSFNPDGRRLLSWGDDPAARVWKVPSGQPACPPLTHEGPISEACFSPDGRLIATASLDGLARVWDADTGEPLTPPLRHGGSVRTVEFHPTGAWLLTAAADQTLRQWALPTNPESPTRLVELCALLSGEPVEGIRLSLAELWQRTDSVRPVPSGSIHEKPEAGALGHELVRLLPAATAAETLGEWPRVIDILSRLLEAVPHDWDWLFRRACARLNLRQWADAESDLAAALRHNTNAAVCVLARSFARGQSGHEEDASADLRLALTLAQGFREGPWQTPSSVRPDPSSPAQWSRLHELAETALLVNSNDVHALAMRAVVEGVHSEWRPASVTFKKARTLRTNDAVVRIGLALTARHLAFWPQLVDAGTAALLRAPHDPLAWALRGEAHLHRREMTNAVADLEHALALGMDAPGLRLLLADAEMTLKHWPQAAAHAVRAAKLDPGHHPATRQAVWLLANGPNAIRDTEEAAAIARLGVERQSDTPLPLVDLGLALYRQDDFHGAITNLDSARLLPGGAISPCRYLLALSHQRLGQTNEALDFHRRARQRPPTDGEPYPGMTSLVREVEQTLGLRPDAE